MKNKKNITYVLVLAAGLAVLLLLEPLHITNVFPSDSSSPTPKAAPTSGGGSSYIDKGEGSKNSENTTASAGPGAPNTPTKSDPQPDQQTLLAPSGTFVSSHRVGLSNNIESTCNTTPFAYCQIVFKSGTTEVQLPKKKTNESGTATWNWTPSSIGMSPSSSWDISADAFLADTMKSSKDAMKLVVSP